MVLKLNAAGELQWVFSGGGPQVDKGYDLAVDSAGNLLLGGCFEGQATFCGQSLSGKGELDALLLKLSPAGELLWAKSWGSAEAAMTYALDVDLQDNVFITGYFLGTMALGSASLTSRGSNDAFVAKLDGQGNVAWAKNIGGGGYESGESILGAGDGGCYLTTIYQDQLQLAGGSLQSKGGYDMLLVRLGPDGQEQWAISGGGEDNDSGSALLLDGAGQLYVGGTFGLDAAFGSVALPGAGREDAFLLKLDASDGTVLAGVSGGGPGADYAQGVALTPAGKLYLVGTFQESATFGQLPVTSAGSWDLFLWELDPL